MAETSDHWRGLGFGDLSITSKRNCGRGGHWREAQRTHWETLKEVEGKEHFRIFEERKKRDSGMSWELSWGWGKILLRQTSGQNQKPAESLGKATLKPVELWTGCAVGSRFPAFVSCHWCWGRFVDAAV